MKNLSRILSVMLCFAPVAYASAGPVATTAGSNLTAYNPSNSLNNQWAIMTNGRYDGNNGSAKVDFGNCNAVILRCAQPKCSNGGCSDMSVASAIVSGCVQSNNTCKQYGNDLVQYMSAQLVASSNAKINEQNAAAANAAAQAAAQAAQQQSQQQTQQMQQMQVQMQQMQQQMAQQQAESAQQLQAALAQQAAQSQAAIENMRSAATEAAMKTESGLTSYEEEAIQRGISGDVLERKKITGQIMTEIENAEASLQEVKVALNAAFEYAKCDARGNNCEGPKRVKKWRELATVFLTPYDNAIDKLYDGLELAQLVGVNLSDIYMMLNNSCNRWGQYMCPKMPNGHIVYEDAKVPKVCPNDMDTTDFVVDKAKFAECVQNAYAAAKTNPQQKMDDATIKQNCTALNTVAKTVSGGGDCRPCTLLKMLSGEDDVYEGWVYGDQDTNSNTTVVACASGALDSSKLFARRTKNKNGAGLVDIDQMDVWLNQKEPVKKYSNGPDPMSYCNADGHQEALEKSLLSKVVPAKGYALCVDMARNGSVDLRREESDCGYISPVYAICDTHPYNVGKTSAIPSSKTTDNTKDCTSEAKNSGSGYANNGHIVWAKRIGEKCVVKLCDSGWEPVEETTQTNGTKGCKENKEYKLDGEKEKDYTARVDEYRQEVLAGYGETKEMLALKITVVSQQMYKQYEYLNATIRRLKTQLEKAVYKSQLEAAGAKNEEGSSSSSSGLLGGGHNSKSSQYRDCSGKNRLSTAECLRENYTTLLSQINNKKCDQNAKKELVNGIETANVLLSKNNKLAGCRNSEDCSQEPKTLDDCKSYLKQYGVAPSRLEDENDAKKRSSKKSDDDD